MKQKLICLILFDILIVLIIIIIIIGLLMMNCFCLGNHLLLFLCIMLLFLFGPKQKSLATT